MGLQVLNAWLDAKVLINSRRKILPCNLGLKSKAEIWAVPMGLQVLNAWLDAKVWMKGLGSKLALKPRIKIRG